MDNEHHHHGTDIKFLAGLFVGGLVGAAAVFFLGTKEGKKAGRMIYKKGEEVVEDLEEQIQMLEQQGKDLVEQGEKIKEQVIEKLEDKKDAMTASATRKLDSTLAHIEELQEHGLDTTSSLRKRLFKNTPKKS